VTLTPSGEFYRVSIALPSGDALTCHVAKVALKIQREEVPRGERIGNSKLDGVENGHG
jgi:hypothetical protein